MPLQTGSLTNQPVKEEDFIQNLVYVLPFSRQAGGMLEKERQEAQCLSTHSLSKGRLTHTKLSSSNNKLPLTKWPMCCQLSYTYYVMFYMPPQLCQVGIILTTVVFKLECALETPGGLVKTQTGRFHPYPPNPCQ